MRTKFLLADTITPGASDKLNVSGLFPDDTIVVTLPASYSDAPDAPPPGMDRLAFLLVVAGLADGAHKISGQLFDPQGKPNSETPVLDFSIANGSSLSLPFQLAPFVISGGAGTYVWKFRVDQAEFSHSFQVRLTKPGA